MIHLGSDPAARPKSWLAALATLAVPAALAGCGGSSQPAAGSGTGPAGVEGQREPTASRRGVVPDIEEEGDAGGPGHDGLEVEGLRGRLEPHEIERGVNPHARALERCYTSHIGRRRYIGGRIALGFVVRRDGAVAGVRLIESDLGAWPIEKCMLEISRAMQFSRPRGNGEAEFSVPLSFAARARGDGWADARTSSEVARLAGQLSGCAGAGGSGAPQDVRVTLYVGARGQVQSVGFAAPEAAIDPAWGDCAEAKILAWRLTDPRGRVAKAGFFYNPR